jgi:predicted transcriptional regulator
MAGKTEPMRVNVTPDIRVRLEAQAQLEDRSVAGIIRRAIQQYLDTPREHNVTLGVLTETDAALGSED